MIVFLRTKIVLKMIVFFYRHVILNRCVPESITRRIGYMWSAVNSIFNAFDDNLIEVNRFNKNANRPFLNCNISNINE